VKKQAVSQAAKASGAGRATVKLHADISFKRRRVACDVERISIHNHVQLSVPESFVVFAVGNHHHVTSLSERQYQGGSAQEALIAVCERMLQPGQVYQARRRPARRTERDCYSEIDDGVMTPWDFGSFQDEPQEPLLVKPDSG
jgi:hypothetical protein